MQTIIPGLSQISLGYVNAFLLEHDGQLTLIDTGVPGSEDKILAAVNELGRAKQDIKNILVTHLHADHAGSLKALKERTGAPAWMHPEDAQMVRKGEILRPFDPRPRIARKLISAVASDVGLRLSLRRSSMSCRRARAWILRAVRASFTSQDMPRGRSRSCSTIRF